MYELQVQDEEGWIGLQSGDNYLALMQEREDLERVIRNPCRVELAGAQ